MLSTMLLILISAVLVTVASAEQCEISKTVYKGNNSICRGELIFNDDFDWLNLDVWTHENTLGGGGNGEFQWYSNNRTNSYVWEGNLYIKPTLTSDHLGEWALTSATLDLNSGEFLDTCTEWWDPEACVRTGSPEEILNPIKSAKLRTTEAFAFTYGRLEIRAKMPAGDWLWPAIWMLPRDNVYGGFPKSGEIDIAESRGNRDLTCWNTAVGVQQIGSTLHWGPDSDHMGSQHSFWEKNNPAGFHNDYHIYEIEKTPDYVKFSIDREQLGIIYPPNGGFWELGEMEQTGLPNPWASGSKMAPFDADFYIILNVAVGGMGYFPDTCSNGNGPKPWSNESPKRRAMTEFWNGRETWMPTWNMYNDDASMIVDYVKVFAL